MDSSDGSNRNPVVICEPPRGLLRVNWAELWKYRELWLTSAARDIKVRYKQTILGALWAILQPLAAMAVFTIRSQRSWLLFVSVPLCANGFLMVLPWVLPGAGGLHGQ